MTFYESIFFVAIPYQNDWEKLKSYGHPRIKLKRSFLVGRPKSLIGNCRKKKSIHKTSSNDLVTDRVEPETWISCYGSAGLVYY